jgi:hypothetical protein
VFGTPGRKAVEERLPSLKEEHGVGFCVVNGENVADGAGITPRLAERLLAAGADVLTLGNHVWRRREIAPYLETAERVVRPANLASSTPGRGLTVVEAEDGTPVAVLNLQGQLFMQTHVSPFEVVDELVEQARAAAKIVLVDFHAEATSEKIAMGWWLDGQASFVFGTHTHIQTADERILPQGTAYITDCGMTGPYESVIGRRVDRVLHRFTTGMPAHFEVATGDVRLCGALATIDSGSGRAMEVKRVVILEDGTVKA